MTRVIVLDDARVVIPDAAVEAIEAIDPSREAKARTPWLFELMNDGPEPPRDTSERRALRLHGGGRVAVPAIMRIDEVAVLELPSLLRPLAEAAGVIGITELGDHLGLVCDPRLLPVGTQAPQGSTRGARA